MTISHNHIERSRGPLKGEVGKLNEVDRRRAKEDLPSILIVSPNRRFVALSKVDRWDRTARSNGTATGRQSGLFRTPEAPTT